MCIVYSFLGQSIHGKKHACVVYQQNEKMLDTRSFVLAITICT